MLAQPSIRTQVRANERVRPSARHRARVTKRASEPQVDEKYCISFVFKGAWKAHLEATDEMTIDPDGGDLERTTDEDGDPKARCAHNPYTRTGC